MTCRSKDHCSSWGAPSDAQTTRFREISGGSWDKLALHGTFVCTGEVAASHGSSEAVLFSYWYNGETGHLRCRLSSREFSDRYYAWDRHGNVVLVPGDPGVKIVTR